MNLIAPSENMNDSGTDWSYTGDPQTITTNNVNPWGVANAWGFAYASGSAYAEIRYLANLKLDSLMAPYGAGRWVLSVYVKPLATQPHMKLKMPNGTQVNIVQFTWTGGVLSAGSFGDSVVAAGVSAEAAGYYRAWIELQVAATNLGWSARTFPQGGSGVIGNGNIYSSWQLEKRTGGPGKYKPNL